MANGTEYEKRYRDMSDITNANVQMKPGEYFAARPAMEGETVGKAITNVPSLAQTQGLNVTADGANYQAQVDYRPGAYKAPEVARPTQQSVYDNLLSAYGRSSQAAYGKMAQDAALLKQQQIAGTSPLQQMQQNIAKTQPGRLSGLERKAFREQQVKEKKAERQKYWEDLAKSERAARVQETQDIATAKKMGELAPAVVQKEIDLARQKGDIATENQLKLEQAKNQNRMARDASKFSQQQIRDEYQHAMKQGDMELAASLKDAAFEKKIEADNKMAKEKGELVGSPEWWQRHREEKDIPEDMRDKAQMDKMIFKAGMDQIAAEYYGDPKKMADAIERLQKGFEERSEKRMGYADSTQNSTQKVESPGEQAKMDTGEKMRRQMRIADAVKVADAITEQDAKKKLDSGEWGEAQYKLYQKAVILKKLTTKKQRSSLEDEVKREYGLED